MVCFPFMRISVSQSANSKCRCVRASLFGWFGQLDGPSAAVKGTDRIRIEYTKTTDSDTWTQLVVSFILTIPH